MLLPKSVFVMFVSTGLTDLIISLNCLHRVQPRFQFSLQDFHCCAVLGRGHFGKVCIVRDHEG